MLTSCRALLLLTPILLAACSDEVKTPPDGDGGSGGSGGATATSGSGGAGGSGSGGAPATCGGFTGAVCEDTQVCVWPDGTCGGADGLGECQPRPEGCDEDCPGVCGCDGQFYCNACMAHQAGVDVAAGATCSSSAGYAAHFWPGGLDHLTVLKADPEADRCLMVYLASPTNSAPGFALSLPQGWGVTHAEITDRAADCAVPPMEILGEVVHATAGSGTIAWEVAPGMYTPCTLDVSASLSFSGAPAWVPPEATLGAAGVAVDGGCQ